MGRREVSATLIGVGLVCALLAPARAASPEALCGKVGTDDRLRPIPSSLVPAAKRLFDLHATSEEIRRTTVFRCADGRVLLCTVGANLPCGKADTRRDLPGTEAWCADHPDADFIPMSVTGHATIYRWRCRGTKAAITGNPVALDRRGFIADLWKRVGPGR